MQQLHPLESFVWFFCSPFFKYQIVLEVNWEYTNNTDCISTKKKTKHLMLFVLHFSRLVSSLLPWDSLIATGYLWTVLPKNHTIMLLVLIIPPIDLVWRFLPSSVEYHKLVQSIIFTFKAGILYCWEELKLYTWKKDSIKFWKCIWLYNRKTKMFFLFIRREIYLTWSETPLFCNRIF